MAKLALVLGLLRRKHPSAASPDLRRKSLSRVCAQSHAGGSGPEGLRCVANGIARASLQVRFSRHLMRLQNGARPEAGTTKVGALSMMKSEAEI